MRNEAELQALVDYVHINPFKRRLVENVAAWPHSSFHRYVARGLLCEGWGAGGDSDEQFGER